MDSESTIRASDELRRRAVLGVFTLAMAREAGFTRGATRHRRAAGTWRHVVGTAFVDVTSPELEGIRRRAVGASLCWPSGVVCLRTAALLHGMPVHDDGSTHVVVSGKRRPSAGLVPHFFDLRPGDTRRMLSFRITSRPRTALDCLALLPWHEAERLMAWVRTREILTVRDLSAAVIERAGLTGVKQLRRLLTLTAGGALSEAERRLHRLLRDAGLRGWEADQRIVVAGRVVARVDVLFRAQRLIVEVDGRLAHQDFEADRARLNTLTLAGYAVLRFTWHQLVEQPRSVLAQIEAALRRAAS